MMPLSVRALATRVLIVAGVIAGCLGATYLAATLALQRPDAWRIDAALASRLTADYSTDDYSAQARPPLNPRVVDAARDDEQATDPARTPASVAPPASTVEPPATAVPRVSTPTPVVAVASSTPQPTATDTPEPEPSDTPEPPATQTPVPSPTATPRLVTCGDKKSGGLAGGECKSPSPTATNTPVPPTPTITPTATPRSIFGCLPLVGGLLGGDKCKSPTPEPADEGEE